MGGELLEMTDTVKDLGIRFTYNMDFSSHILELVSQSLKLLGFIYRHTTKFSSQDSLKILFFSLVRSKLEYCSTVWNPYQIKYINKIESVQKRFIRFLFLKSFGYYPSWNNESSISYSSLLSLFNFESLQHRRNNIDIKCLHNLLTSSVNSHLLSRIAIHVPRENCRTSKTFNINYARTCYYKYSPLLRICSFYNKLSNIDIFQDRTTLLREINTGSVQNTP